MFAKLYELVSFVLVQILPGRTLPQQCINFSLRKKTALFIGLIVGGVKSFSGCRPRISDNPGRKRGFSICQLDWACCKKKEKKKKHVMTPHCPSHLHRSSSRHPHLPRHHHHSNSHRRGRSLRREVVRVCGHSTQLVWWAPSHHHAQPPP